MTLPKRIASGVLLLSLLLAGVPGWAVTIPVIDVAAIGQLLTQYKAQIEQYALQIRQYQNELQQIRNQIQQIQYAYETVKHGVANLQRLNLTYASDMLSLGTQLTNKLDAIQSLGYDTQQAIANARSLYPRIQGVLSGPQLRQQERQMSAMERANAQIALEVQSVLGTHRQQEERISRLMREASQAQGNLQVQQAQAQQQGIIATQLLSIEEQLATQSRQQSMQVLRETVRTEATQSALEEASQTVTLSPASGHILPVSK